MKSALRFTCLKRRDAIEQIDHEKWSFAACERLAALLYARGLHGRKVALYNPIKSELDVTPVLHALYAEGMEVSLPVVECGRPFLEFYRFHSALALEPGSFGVLEPERVKQSVPDTVIVPLVGFDRAGHRIGYGKGYYDATLTLLRAENPGLLAIGMGFALQEVAEVPADTHDARLDAIVTETEMITP